MTKYELDTEISFQPKFKFKIKFDEKDISRMSDDINKLFKSEFNAFKSYPIISLCEAVNKLVEVIVNDRCKEKICKGGWGCSDYYYMTYLYKNTNIKESITTTVLAAEALSYAEKLAGGNVLQNIWDELEEYIDRRWNKKGGTAGTLAEIIHEEKPIENCRHTATMLRLWSILPGKRERIEHSLRGLLTTYEKIEDWTKEKVSTEIAAFKAFELILQNEYYQLCGVPFSRIKYYRDCMIDSIVSKYDETISGWTPFSSGKSEENIMRSRQLYTLYLLREMYGSPAQSNAALNRIVQKALKATLAEPWRGIGNKGTPVNPFAKTEFLDKYLQSEKKAIQFDIDAQEDINSTILLTSVLLQKNNSSERLDANERKALLDGIDYIMKYFLKGNQKSYCPPFTWAVSYFLKDLCVYLAKMIG